MSGNYTIIASIHPPRDNTTRVSIYTNYLHETKTGRIDPNDGLKVDDNEKLEEMNNPKKRLATE